MVSNMIWLGVVAAIALLVWIAYLYFRPKEHVEATPFRELLNAFLAALRSEHAMWNARQDDGSPPINTETETGRFAFLSPDGTVHAIYDASGQTSSLRILCGEHQADIAYVGGSVSSVAFDNTVLGETHADVRLNAAFLRKIRTHVRAALAFRVAPEELEDAPKEFAKPTGRTIDYGRSSDRPRKKKRSKRAEQTDSE